MAWGIVLCTAHHCAWEAEWFNLAFYTQISNWGLLSRRESYYSDWVTLNSWVFFFFSINSHLDMSCCCWISWNRDSDLLWIINEPGQWGSFTTPTLQHTRFHVSQHNSSNYYLIFLASPSRALLFISLQLFNNF